MGKSSASPVGSTDIWKEWEVGRGLGPGTHAPTARDGR